MIDLKNNFGDRFFLKNYGSIFIKNRDPVLCSVSDFLFVTVFRSRSDFFETGI